MCVARSQAEAREAEQESKIEKQGRPPHLALNPRPKTFSIGEGRPARVQTEE